MCETISTKILKIKTDFEPCILIIKIVQIFHYLNYFIALFSQVDMSIQFVGLNVYYFLKRGCFGNLSANLIKNIGFKIVFIFIFNFFNQLKKGTVMKYMNEYSLYST